MGERLLPFVAEAMHDVPRAGGAYFLFRGRDLLCAAVAAGGANLHSELSARLCVDTGRCRATHFAWITTDDPLQAYRLQLAAHALWDVSQTTASAHSSSKGAPGRRKGWTRVRSDSTL